MQKEIQVNRKGSKKLFGTYIYKVLSEESSEDNRFSVRQLQSRIEERFGQAIERSTMQGHIRVLKANPHFNIEGDETGYFFPKEIGPLYIDEGNRLDDMEITYLVELIRTSKRFTYYDREAIKEKLINQCVEITTKDYLLNKDMIHKDKPSTMQRLQDRLINDLPIIIENNRPMMIKFKNQNDYKKFLPYAAVSIRHEYVLVGRYENKKDAVRIFSRMIEDYKYLENETFEKNTLHIYGGFGLDKRLLQLLRMENKDCLVFHFTEELK